jgi:hypothetical protein
MHHFKKFYFLILIISGISIIKRVINHPNTKTLLVRLEIKQEILLKSKCDCRKEKISITGNTKDQEKATCDLYNVLRRGYGHKVVLYLHRYISR